MGATPPFLLPALTPSCPPSTSASTASMDSLDACVVMASPPARSTFSCCSSSSLGCLVLQTLSAMAIGPLSPFLCCMSSPPLQASAHPVGVSLADNDYGVPVPHCPPILLSFCMMVMMNFLLRTLCFLVFLQLPVPLLAPTCPAGYWPPWLMPP
jgi:hypothetical protein